jgi:hypothetical protein
MMAMVAVLTLLAAGCGGGGGDSSDDDASPTTAAAGTTAAGSVTTAAPSSGPSTNFTLKITEVRLVNSEESDSGMRILLPAGVASASVTVTSGLPSPNRVISVCQASELDRRMSGASCRMPSNGEGVTVTLGTAAKGVELAQVGVASAGPEGNSALLDEVVIRYAASSRELNVRLPQIAAGGSGGRPAFSLTPPSTDGAYRATFAWTVIPVFGGSPSTAQLELVQGGNTTNQMQSGGVEVRLNGTVSPPGEAAIRVQNVGTSALVAPKLTLLLP